MSGGCLWRFCGKTLDETDIWNDCLFTCNKDNFSATECRRHNLLVILQQCWFMWATRMMIGERINWPMCSNGDKETYLIFFRFRETAIICKWRPYANGPAKTLAFEFAKKKCSHKPSNQFYPKNEPWCTISINQVTVARPRQSHYDYTQYKVT